MNDEWRYQVKFVKVTSSFKHSSFSILHQKRVSSRLVLLIGRCLCGSVFVFAVN